MSINFYNTLSRSKEEFQPLEAGIVRLYTCGPTVYNFAHIGNYRAFVFEDLLRRYLKFKGLRVVQVMNITDIDDKSVKAANQQGFRFAISPNLIDSLHERPGPSLRISRILPARTVY
jgi:cysteinyl-tRNA synthetase